MIRIVHISDLHLSKDNLFEFQSNYMQCFLEDVKSMNADKQIDLVFITGDLVDKGGVSFISEDYFAILKKDVIEEIANAINIESHKIVIVAGNHDVHESQDKITSSGIEVELSKLEKINDFITKH